MLPKVQAAVAFAESAPGRESLITLLEKAKDGINGLYRYQNPSVNNTDTICKAISGRATGASSICKAHEITAGVVCPLCGLKLHTGVKPKEFSHRIGVKKTMKMIVKNGMLCTESGVYEADILIENGVSS